MSLMFPHATTGPSSRLARYDFIDSLRGLAFLGVLLHHAAPRVPGLNPTVARFANEGHEGVELFFLASALTLFLSLDSRRRSERRPIRNFFIRRFFRIAPLFYIGALFYHGYDRSMTGGSGAGGSSLGCILTTLVFLNGWSVPWINRLVPGGWSIAVEMNFYLLVPWLFRKLRGLRDAAQLAFAALLVGGAASSGIRWTLHRWSAGASPADVAGFSWYWLPTQFPIFCLGFVLFFILRPILKGGETDGPARPSPRLLLLLAAYLVASVTFSETALYLGHFLFGIAFLALAWSLALHPTRWLVNPVTRYVGKVSFSAYLSHFAVLDLVEWGLLGHWPAFTSHRPEVQFAALLATCAALTVLVSTLTYRLIEVPGQDLGRALIAFLEARATSRQDVHSRPAMAMLTNDERLPPASIVSSDSVAGP